MHVAGRRTRCVPRAVNALTCACPAAYYASTMNMVRQSSRLHETIITRRRGHAGFRCRHHPSGAAPWGGTAPWGGSTPGNRPASLVVGAVRRGGCGRPGTAGTTRHEAEVWDEEDGRRYRLVAGAFGRTRGRAGCGGLQGPPLVHPLPEHAHHRLSEQSVRRAGLPHRRTGQRRQHEDRRGGRAGALSQLRGERRDHSAERAADHAELRGRHEEGGRRDRGPVARAGARPTTTRSACRGWATGASATA